MELVKDKYHHGDLKKEMILKGLQLLNKEGLEGLSLRKVAIRCGVSHAAPYKHFKNKEALMAAITAEVVDSFTSALGRVACDHSGDPEGQIVALGEQYVKFMVENPDYLKFLFLSGQKAPILIRDGEFADDREITSFTIFKNSAMEYLRSINANAEDRAVDILTMWSLVHGFAVLMANQSIEYSGDYQAAVSKMIREKLRFEESKSSES